ncbi:hypothetical protein QBC45DRAFT_135359 [Copromyces sp. CBS 386.78]|nr:hypothetical protein QBC45DRAFT_135359 [Copromyces sp. CBS 386.78]
MGFGFFSLLFLCCFASRFCLTWVKSLIPFIRGSLWGWHGKLLLGNYALYLSWPRQRPLGRRAWLLDMDWGSITLWRCPESRLSILGQAGLLSLGYGGEDRVHRKLPSGEEN